MVRRLLVRVVVIVMALAAGIALGGGPLSDIGRTPSQAAPPSAPQSDPRVEARADFGDAFAGSVASSLYDGRLAGQSVVLLTLPGADPDVAEQLAAEVSAAGGTLTAMVAVKGKMVDASNKSLVDTLGEQVVEQLGDDVVTVDATTYDRAGQLLGRAYVARNPKKALAPEKVASLRASLEGAGLIEGPADDDPAMAGLVLVLTGSQVEQPVLNGLVAGLAAVATGVVVAGPTEDPGLADLRAEPPSRPAATVDGTEAPAGRVAAVLALVHAVSAPGGSFGASGSDGAVPLG